LICFYRYHIQTGIYGGINISASLDQHLLHRTPVYHRSFIEYVDQINSQSYSLSDQEEIINSIENDPNTQEHRKPAKDSYFSTGDFKGNTNTEKLRCKSCLPTSKRNRAIYFYMKRSRSQCLDALGISDQPQNSQQQLHPPSLSSRKSTSHTAPPAQDDHHIPDVSQSHNVDVPSTSDVIPTAATDNTPYVQFKHALVESHGVLQWRVHTNNMDIIAMNDINMLTGKFHNNSFVHLTREVTADGNVIFECTCSMSPIIHQIEQIPRCCHARFFVDHMEEHINTIFTLNKPLEATTPTTMKIAQSLAKKQDAVVKLGTHKTYHRFSVRDSKSCAIVHLQGKRFTCQSGECSARKTNIRKVIHIGDAASCPHMKVLNANEEAWNKIPGVVNNDQEDAPMSDQDELQSNPDQLPPDQEEPLYDGSQSSSTEVLIAIIIITPWLKWAVGDCTEIQHPLLMFCMDRYTNGHFISKF